MLKVKNLTHLSKKKMKKRREFLPRHLVSRVGLILTKIVFSIEWT